MFEQNIDNLVIGLTIITKKTYLSIILNYLNIMKIKCTI